LQSHIQERGFVYSFRVRQIAKLLLFTVALSVGVSGQGPVEATLSGDLLWLLRRGDDRPVRAIIRGEVDTILTGVARDQLRVIRVLDGFVVVSAAAAELNALRLVPGVLSISRDNIVAPLMTVSERAMAADLARQGQTGLLGLSSLPTVSGAGVGVAVVDSGFAAHPALNGRVAAAVSFVSGDPSTGDGFGHGTHIAGTIAGSGDAAARVTAGYRGGIAPGAHLVNVRVLGNEGVGYTSDVIAGIQWVIGNRDRYAIRVVNLSLGHPVVESCLTDPLCLTVERAAAAGLVVVASAGNGGKDAQGRRVLASISTPGNAALAITVGALNTFGTVQRNDDGVTTYSSRGPTRFDLRLKPDVVAPGNRILSLGVSQSALARRFPQQLVGTGSNSYFVMSGTSMAAAMVSGVSALLMERGPGLTVHQVKAALQLSASFMANEGLLSAGAGSVNAWSARRVHGAVQSALGVIPPVAIGGVTARPGGLLVSQSGSLVDHLVAGGTLPVFNGLDLVAGWRAPERLLQRTQALGLLNPLAGLAAPQLVFGRLADTLGQQIIWSDNQPGGMQIIWSDDWIGPGGQQIIWSDHDATDGYQIIWSDTSPTEGSQIIWSDTSRTHGDQIIWSDSLHDE
jgi:subtilisin family serine protease